MLPPKLIDRCINTLLKCREFKSDRHLRTIFLSGELANFRFDVPEAFSIKDRVDKCLDFLLSHHLGDGRPVLLPFLEALSKRYKRDDSLYTNLEELTHSFEEYLQFSSEEDMARALSQVSTRSVSFDAVEGFLRGLKRSGGGVEVDLERFIDPSGSVVLDPSFHKTQELEYLALVESLIREELSRSNDEHFVELSMELANPGSSRGVKWRRHFARTFGGPSTEQCSVSNPIRLEDALKDHHSLVLLGAPGSGKTTVLRHLTLFLIRAYREGQSEVLPLFVPLTKYISPHQSAMDFLRTYVTNLVGEHHFIARYFDSLAKFGRFIFILDGLDQMPNRKSETPRLRLLQQVEFGLRVFDQLIRLVQKIKHKGAVSTLVQSQRIISAQLALQVDPREQAIERLRLPGSCHSAVIVSCRQHDFIGTPNWPQISILPMSESEITAFVEKYASEARNIVFQHLGFADATRSLVSNPFYLKVLTEALEEAKSSPEGISIEQLSGVAKRRGKLLEYLIRCAVERELGDILKADELFELLGELAYYMLKENVTGPVPYDVVARFGGSALVEVMGVAQNVGLVSVHDTPPISVEFTHQLYLEFLLAYHLKERIKPPGGFKRVLTLLAHRGDRWAEAIKLLFEMVDDETADVLLDRFKEALRHPNTWDISVRVLADVGHSAGPRLFPLLKRSNELARRGAIKVLGRIKAVEYMDALAELKDDPDWHIRRAAVDALVAMGRIYALTKFDEDSHPMVIRAVFKGKLQRENKFKLMDFILTEIESGNDIRQVQMAWAVHDFFSDILSHQPEEQILELLSKLMAHKSEEVRFLGYLMSSQSPEHLQRRLKSDLLHGALHEGDDMTCYIARKTVRHFLTARDLQQVESWSRILDPDANKRATLLLAEAREFVNSQEHFRYLLSAPIEEIELLTYRLSKRTDSAALSVLVYLLGNPRASQAALDALISIGLKGVSHLLAALDDPLPEVRIGAAQFLKFCHLPCEYAHKVRSELRSRNIHTHQVKTVTELLGFASDEVPGGCMAAITFALAFVSPFIYRLTGSFWGVEQQYWYWFGFNLFPTPATIDAFSTINRIQISQTEKQAFVHSEALPDSEFWLTRGRIMQAVGQLDEAEKAFHLSLESDWRCVSARYELAMIARKQGKLEKAQTWIEAGEGQYIEKGSDLEALHKLLEMERSRQTVSQSGLPQVQHVQILVQLRLWDEALPKIIQLCRSSTPPDDVYFFLYQCYRDTGKSRRALAAALANNASNKGQPIPKIELDNLRWLHRMEGFPVHLSGQIGVLLDLRQYTEALELLQCEGLLPSSDIPLAQSKLDWLYDLQPSVQRDLLFLLEQVEDNETLRVIRNMIGR